MNNKRVIFLFRFNFFDVLDFRFFLLQTDAWSRSSKKHKQHYSF